MKKAIILFVCLLLMVPAAIAATWSGNSADVNISYDSYPDNLSSRFPQITAGPEGNLYCIWRQGPSSGAGELYFGKSTDNGATWSSYTSDNMISANDGQNVGGNEHAFAITTNSAGDIFVVWYEDLVDNYEIMLLKSTDYGDTWIHDDADFNISYSGSTVDAYDPEIAIDHNDNIYVVWNQDIATADSSEIHISISTDNGDTWSGTAADRYISYYNSSDASGAAIAITPNDDIFVVWREKNDPTNIDTYTIMYGKSTDGGATFNSETADHPTSVNVRASYAPEIAADNYCNIHVVWKGYETSGIPAELFYTGSTDGGATWSGNSGMRIVDFGFEDGAHVHNPAFTATAAGKLIAVWQETINPYQYAAIFASYSHDGGLTWTGHDDAPQIVDFPDGRGAYNPDVAAGANDTVYVVWNESLQQSGSNYYDVLISIGDTLVDTLGAFGRCCYNNGQDCIDTTVAGCQVLSGIWHACMNCVDNPCTAGDPIGRCCYDNNASCMDTTEARCTDLGGNWDEALNCDNDPCPITGCHYSVGDVNGSNSYNGLDITYGVAFFKGGADPLCDPCPLCPDWNYCGDVNGSCTNNGLDITYGVAYFKGGANPIPCPDCPPIE